ncbi:MAG: PmoA family protein [Sedimentisphaerales bacterium]|nr:PmoA family protein [Sedimentisphaerales bacterium]
MRIFARNSGLVWFFAVSLAAGRFDSTASAEGIHISTDTDVVSIAAGEQILLRYRYRDVPYKPYVDRLFTPGGVNVLLDAPADHLHHHGLMYAITVDGVNFWEEQQAPGQQVHLGFDNVTSESRNETSRAGFSERLCWKNPHNEELLLTELRSLRVRCPAGSKVTLLTWQSRFEPADGRKSATLTGAHYHGLGLRFIRSMDTGGRFVNADGKAGTIYRGDERLVRSRWCAYKAKADGKDVTVAMFDHPENKRHPATWFTMSTPFAYLSATLNLHEESMELVSGKPLVLRYGIALWDGQVEGHQIEKLYQSWTAMPTEGVNAEQK